MPDWNALRTAKDIYREVVYHDEAFHAFMDGMVRMSARCGPDIWLWRNWPYRQVRRYAKAWAFGRRYGMQDTRIINVLEVKR